ncbi:hypothetical protein UT300003_00440 [Clostridium sardiniense]|uniref:hypothetical protein n=1 Tax=Clostridium sardiniense TaxID=29369 RepID=UPI001957FE11|nr:hypothetical protein [Clostridium sardiniense]MBM7834666.1 hypothetical protein [Clostridium sardiniense]
MKSDSMNDFNEFMKQFGFNFRDNNCNNRDNAENFDPDERCEDIPGGFQDLHPQLFVLIGDIMGQIMAGEMPFNVQNAIGNWFELIGQVILTYSAQQQYFQNGPGRYYKRKNKNVGNPFCEANPTPDNAADHGGIRQNTNYDTEINILKGNMESLTKEIESLKAIIRDINK